MKKLIFLFSIVLTVLLLITSVAGCQQSPVPAPAPSPPAPKAPPPRPGPLFIVVTLPHEARYLPGEPVAVQLVFTNTTSGPLTLEYVPQIHVTKHLDTAPVLYSQVGAEQRVDTKPDEKIITDFIWDQKDTNGEQVPPGWYDITWKPPDAPRPIDRKIGLGSSAMVLIQHPQME